MSFAKMELGKEALSQGATTGDAKLAGLPGTGTMQVWRGQSENVLRVVGTWRLQEDSGGLEKIREALARSEPVSYDGVLDDPAQAGRRRVSTKVYVTSIGSYQRGGSDDSAYCYVNFVPIDRQEVTG